MHEVHRPQPDSPKAKLKKSQVNTPCTTAWCSCSASSSTWPWSLASPPKKTGGNRSRQLCQEQVSSLNGPKMAHNGPKSKGLFSNSAQLSSGQNVCMVSCYVFPPQWYGSPGTFYLPTICGISEVQPRIFKLFAALLRSGLVVIGYVQHVWLPASDLLGICYRVDFRWPIYIVHLVPQYVYIYDMIWYDMIWYDMIWNVYIYTYHRYIHIYVYIYTRISIYIYVYTYIHIYVCIYYVYIYIYV